MFDKFRPDYDPDLDFPPLKPANWPETLETPLVGNSLKAQMEEIWARKGVVEIAHVVVWIVEHGRIIGRRRGKLLCPAYRRRKPAKRKRLL